MVSRLQIKKIYQQGFAHLQQLGMHCYLYAKYSSILDSQKIVHVNIYNKNHLLHLVYEPQTKTFLPLALLGNAKCKHQILALALDCLPISLSEKAFKNHQALLTEQEYLFRQLSDTPLNVHNFNLDDTNIQLALNGFIYVIKLTSSVVTNQSSYMMVKSDKEMPLHQMVKALMFDGAFFKRTCGEIVSKHKILSDSQSYSQQYVKRFIHENAFTLDNQNTFILNEIMPILATTTITKEQKHEKALSTK